jgi:hypothetical protein
MARTLSVTSDALTIVELLARNEVALGRLYQGYAAALPSLSDLWLRLAGEEQHHAEWLRSLTSRIAATDPPSACSWPRRAAVESSLKHIETQVLRANQPGLTVVAALSIAKDLESSLLEKEFFRAVQGICPEVEAVLSRLIAATEKHRQLVVDALKLAKDKLTDPAQAL